MTFDIISDLHMQIQTWHPPLWLCTHAKYYVKSGLTNVLKNANKTKNKHLFSIRIANYGPVLVTMYSQETSTKTVSSRGGGFDRESGPNGNGLYTTF